MGESEVSRKDDKRYDKGCVTQRSMPFWCVGNPLSDPFGGAVLPRIDALDVATLIAEAGQAGLVELTGFHDDDLVSWNPDQLDDDLDPRGEVGRRLRAIKRILDDAGVGVNTMTCSLHGNPVFRNGGLCNPDPGIRRLAARKVERALRIGSAAVHSAASGRVLLRRHGVAAARVTAARARCRVRQAARPAAAG